MVVAAVVVRRQRPLAIHGSPELAAPHHKRVFEQAPLLQVSDERRCRLIGVLTLRGNLFLILPITDR